MYGLRPFHQICEKSNSRMSTFKTSRFLEKQGNGPLH
jgi:hypothetical protein